MGFLELPDPLAVAVLSYLDGASVARAARVSHALHRLAHSKRLWTQLARSNDMAAQAAQAARQGSLPTGCLRLYKHVTVVAHTHGRRMAAVEAAREHAAARAAAARAARDALAWLHVPLGFFTSRWVTLALMPFMLAVLVLVFAADPSHWAWVVVLAVLVLYLAAQTVAAVLYTHDRVFDAMYDLPCFDAVNTHLNVPYMAVVAKQLNSRVVEVVTALGVACLGGLTVALGARAWVPVEVVLVLLFASLSCAGYVAGRIVLHDYAFNYERNVVLGYVATYALGIVPLGLAVLLYVYTAASLDLVFLPLYLHAGIIAVTPVFLVVSSYYFHNPMSVDRAVQCQVLSMVVLAGVVAFEALLQRYLDGGDLSLFEVVSPLVAMLGLLTCVFTLMLVGVVNDSLD